MEKNSEPNKTFTHKVKRFLTKVVRLFKGEKTVFPKAVLGERNIHMPRNEAQFSSVTQSCPTHCDPMNCSLPGSSAHSVFQARILEWVAISSSRRSFWPRGWTHVSCVSCTGRQILYCWAISILKWRLYYYSGMERPTYLETTAIENSL